MNNLPILTKMVKLVRMILEKLAAVFRLEKRQNNLSLLLSLVLETTIRESQLNGGHLMYKSNLIRNRHDNNSKKGR